MELQTSLEQAKNIKLREKIAKKESIISNIKAPKDSIILSINSLASMLKAGLSLMDCMKILAKQSSNKSLNKVYTSISEDIEKGDSIANAMRKYPNIFSEMMITLIESGEKSGTLEKNLLFLSEFLKKENNLNKKIKGALLYPIVILGMTVVELVGMVFIIMPKMEELFSSFPNIPDFTRMIVTISQGIRNYWYLIIIGVVFLIFLLKLYLKTPSGHVFTDKLQLNFPIIHKLFRGNILATFSRTFNVLLGGGIPMAKAIHITAITINNSVYRKILDKVYDEVKRGNNVADTLKLYPKEFPESFIRMVEVGESTGTLEQNLNFLYEFYSDEVEELSNNITTMIEPILMIFVGIVIGILAIAIITPLYQFTSSINA